MNPGQEKFLNFILERVQEVNVDDIKKLLAESFAKQQDGSFTLEYMEDVQNKITTALKPEYVEEVKQAMNHFSSQM